MNNLDLLVQMRADMDALERERDEIVSGWGRRRGLLADVDLVLRRVMEYPEIWDIAPTVSQLLVRIREEIGLDEAA